MSSGDYISRQKAREVFLRHLSRKSNREQAVVDWHYVKVILGIIPAADVRPVVRGHWIGAYNDLKCSVCGKNWDELRTADGEDWGYWEDIPPYCPNCGADMTGGADE